MIARNLFKSVMNRQQNLLCRYKSGYLYRMLRGISRRVPVILLGRHGSLTLVKSNADKRRQICRELDSNGFDWQIWAVAGTGFLTDSYNLFSTNVILPSLAFIYWNKDVQSDHETAINAITLTGSLVGQLVFGFLTDRFGRKRLYGVELIVVIFGTIGFVQCSAGYNNESMSILGWIMFWRFFVGLGKAEAQVPNLNNSTLIVY